MLQKPSGTAARGQCVFVEKCPAWAVEQPVPSDANALDDEGLPMHGRALFAQRAITQLKFVSLKHTGPSKDWSDELTRQHAAALPGTLCFGAVRALLQGLQSGCSSWPRVAVASQLALQKLAAEVARLRAEEAKSKRAALTQSLVGSAGLSLAYKLLRPRPPMKATVIQTSSGLTADPQQFDRAVREAWDGVYSGSLHEP
eukprot:13739881-Alexandrium_andersonii.AAC.1